MRVLTFAPEDTPSWNSQAHLKTSSGGSFPAAKGLTVCYRLKIFRFLPDIYWVDAFNYFNEGEEGFVAPNEIRSREFTSPKNLSNYYFLYKK